MTTVRLRGIGWDHPRCTGPLEALAAAWTKAHPGIRIDWSYRPLSAFNDQPIQGLAGGYDLLVIDHPHVPAAATAGALLPLDQHVPAAALRKLAAAAVGPSHTSYTWNGHQWALALDAACQVSAARPDLLAAAGHAWPATWADVLAVARSDHGRVALPLTPADAFCSLLSLCAGLGAPVELPDRPHVDPAAVELLAELAALAHPDSFELAPPALLARMTASNRIAYLPLTFGYALLMRAVDERGRPSRRRLAFGNVPAFDPADGPRGAVLGGAGIAVSASSAHPAEAAAFAAWACTPGPQAKLVVPAGGQPGAAAVWDDPAAAGGFFFSTRRSMRTAYVRPHHPGWPEVQRRGGEYLAKALHTRFDPDKITATLDAMLAPLAA